jgi:hypothetical protein
MHGDKIGFHKSNEKRLSIRSFSSGARTLVCTHIALCVLSHDLSLADIKLIYEAVSAHVLFAGAHNAYLAIKMKSALFM